MLSMSLEAVITQALLPRIDGKGRVLAMEIMIPNPAIRNLIRENKIHQIYSSMQMGQEKFGMQTFNQSLANLYFRKLVSLDMIMTMTSSPEELTDIIQRREGVKITPAGAGRVVQKIGAEPPKGEVNDADICLERQEPLRGHGRGRACRRFQGRAGPPAPEGPDHGPQRRPRPRAGSQIPFLKREKVKLKELAVYSRQLSVLIDAELPLIQSLGILEEQQKNTYFKNVIKTVKEDVEAGSTLNQAKRKHPKAFDDLYCNLIASGEQSGSLDIMLRRLSEFIEKTVRLRAKVKQAMIYPVGHRHLRRPRGHLHALEGHPRLRRDLPRPRRRAALADGRRRQA